MRPESHREQQHEKSCGNCRHSRLVAYKLDLLCFYGDSIEIRGQSNYPVTADYVALNGEEVGLMEGDQYDNVWAGRIIDPSDACDLWEPAASRADSRRALDASR